ncbi:hypothetical protein [Halomicrobium katesii]|uniref:hypothetical protein n=1 Tax=Halomicrobium katesii TaxID=437163 RepID=UPI00035D9EBD|nr:hypothetical protein [Halomicrobium katesii]
MRDTDTHGDATECTTTGSFGNHGIDDGAALIHSTYYRLISGGRETFEPTAAFYDSLESAFLWAYLGSVDEAGVPDHVEAAIDDARAVTADEFADRPDADLRTEVVPTFYQQVAGFHCEYRG